MRLCSDLADELLTVRLSVYDFVWQSVSHLTLACTDAGRLKKILMDK